MNSIRAELFLLLRRPSALVVGVVWVAMSLVFGLVIPLIVHAAIGSQPTASVPDPAAIVAGLRPSQAMSTTAGLYPLYGSALMLVLGAVVFGTDFRNRTWATVFAQEPRRYRVVLAKALALVVAVVAITLVDVVVMTLASAVIGASMELSASLPPLSEYLRGTASCAFIGSVGALLGAMLAVLTRGTAIAVGIGLVWMLAVENLMSSLSGVAPVFEHIRAVFPGGSAGSIVSALGGSARTMPGVAHLGSTGVEAAVLAAYAAVALVVAVTVVSRRDA